MRNQIRPAPPTDATCARRRSASARMYRRITRGARSASVWRLKIKRGAEFIAERLVIEREQPSALHFGHRPHDRAAPIGERQERERRSGRKRCHAVDSCGLRWRRARRSRACNRDPACIPSILRSAESARRRQRPRAPRSACRQRASSAAAFVGFSGGDARRIMQHDAGIVPQCLPQHVLDPAGFRRYGRTGSPHVGGASK